VHGQNDLRTEFAAATLVGLGGVGEAVAENDFARVESGLNDLGDSLGAVGEHERHLGGGSKVGIAGVEQDLADAVAGGGSPRLAGYQRGVAAPVQPGSQLADLGSFAGAVEALERDELPARHGLSLTLRPALTGHVRVW